MIRLGTTLLCAFLIANTASAGPGHDHGHDHGAQPEVTARDIPKLESAGSDLELVATANAHKLTIYLDRLETNEPVAGAAIEVSGEGIPISRAAEVEAGTYEIEAEWLDKPGTYPLVFTVAAGDMMDLLNGTLEVHEPSAAEPVKPISWAELLSMPGSWVFGLLMLMAGFFLSFAFRPSRLPDTPEQDAPAARAPVTPKPVRQTAALLLTAIVLSGVLLSPVLAGPGHDHGHDEHDTSAAHTGGDTPRKLPEGDVFLPKSSQRLLRVRTATARAQVAAEGRELIGTVIPDPSSFGHVQAPMDGQISLTDRGIAFVGQRVTPGEVLAMLAPTMPVFDRGSLQQMAAEVEGKLRIAEQKLSRLTRISGVVAQREIEDTKAELDALREQKRVLEPKSAEKLQLSAPVGGVISVANVKPGQVVSARDTLFEIVDPQRLWIEAIGLGGHDEMNVQSAHAIDVEGHSIKLSYINRSPTLRQQSLPILFKVEDTHEALTIGSKLKVIMQGSNDRRGIVLPDAAVVRAPNGLPQVWIKAAAERFKPLAVRTAPLDGGHVLVVAGIEEGSRVVVEGAELINQIR